MQIWLQGSQITSAAQLFIYKKSSMEWAHLPLIGTSFSLKNDTLYEKGPFLFLMTFPRSSLEAINPQVEMSVDG